MNSNQKQITNIIVTVFAFVLFLGFSTMTSGAQELVIEARDDQVVVGPETAYVSYGLDAYEIGDFEEALVQFNRAIEESPDFAYGYTGRAYINMQYGEFELALEDIQFALELNPRHTAAHYLLGEIYFELGSFADARFHYEAYKTSVEIAEKEPLMIVVLIGDGSLAMLDQHLETCILELSQGSIS